MKNYALQNRSKLAESNYVRIANPNTNYWVDFHLSKIREYESKFGDNFNLVIIGDENVEGDFYTIPYWLVKSMFTEEHLYRSPRVRWMASVNFHQLNIRKNQTNIDVGIYYGVLDTMDQDHEGMEKASELQADYAIENRKMEINARQKQSVFRARVLSNFGNQCCLSDTVEENLLIASHIIPWSENIQTRLDPANGLCLSFIYDKLFDEGYFSLSNDYHVITTNRVSDLSRSLQNILGAVDDRKIREPQVYPISKSFLEYHRENRLIR